MTRNRAEKIFSTALAAGIQRWMRGLLLPHARMASRNLAEFRRMLPLRATPIRTTIETGNSIQSHALTKRPPRGS
jgi:hypothetical protein